MQKHPDADAFMRKYLEQPADTTARLVFADWLDETGVSSNAAWAAYIRLTAEADLHDPSSRSHAALSREAEYHAQEVRAKLTIPARLVVDHIGSLVRLLPAPNLCARLAGFDVPQEVRELMPESVARENLVMPLAARDRWLLCATVAPRDGDTRHKLEFILNRDILLVGADERDVRAELDRQYGTWNVEHFDSPPLFMTTFEAVQSYELPEAIDTSLLDPDAPVLRLVNLIMQEAANLRADRILLFPDLDALAVRYRIDGEWVEGDRIPLRLMIPITARLAEMAGIGGHRDFRAPAELPFTGEFTVQFPGGRFRVRATIQPSPDGPTTQLDLARESAVLA